MGDERLETVFFIAAFILGACIGSFLNVLIYRLPRGTFFSGGKRSHCPQCGAQIPSYANLPILGWLLLRGKALCCKEKISIQYPLVEIITGLAFLGLFLYRSPWTGGQWDSHRLALFFIDSFLVSNLIAASVIDLQHKILPDVLNFSGLAVGLLLSLMIPELHQANYVFRQLDTLGVEARAFMDSLSGAVVGGGLLYGIAVLGRLVFRKEAMGLGDVKFMVFAGAFLGPEGVLLTLLLAAILGSVLGILISLLTGDSLIPFGPFLALGFLMTHFQGANLSQFAFETWPKWLRTSPMAVPLVLGFCGFCLLGLFWLRSLRRRGGSD
jgi:leader peptidase (prepilin peptidase)/N-methyltransferase